MSAKGVNVGKPGRRGLASVLPSVVGLSFCIASTASAADWYGTSLDAEGHAQWNDAANWESTTGVPVGNINFTESVINGKSGSKTVYLDGAYTFWGNYHLYAGTESAPLTFKASGSNGFAATENKEMYIGSGAANPAYVVLDGGTYTFMNDVKPGWNMSDATFVIKENTRVQCPHWFRIADGNSTPSTIGKAVVRIEGGEVVCGWRNNAESDNSCFILGDRDASRAEFIMTDGRITCGGAKNEPAMRFGRGTGSEVSALISGGLLEAKNTNGQVLIGGGTDSKAIVNMTGGSWSSAGDFRIASDGARGYAVMTNDGGTVTCGLNFAVGAQNGTDGTYVHKSGMTTISGTAYIGRHDGTGRAELSGGDVIVNGAQMLLGSGNPLGTSAVELNGGTLSVKKLAAEGGTATVVFNGGTLKALASNLSAFVPKADNFTLSIGARGATVDTASYIVDIESDIGSAVEEGETDGGLTVTGRGILVLHAAANYNGPTKVEQGVLDFRNGMSFTGPVEIGRNGAITVEVTPVYTAAQEEIAAKQAEYDAEEVAEGEEHQVVVPTVADLLLNKKVALFSASALSFEEATDDITTSVFLTGPVVGYTLSSEEENGRTTVYATITDVTNIATSRKVTTFVSGAELDTGLADPLFNHHVDQNASFSNGMPTGNSSEFDVVVFPGDSLMYIWTGYDKHAILNYKAMGDFVVRGGTVWVRINNDLERSPRLGARHVAGNGTLKLTQVGLEAVDGMNGTLVVEPTVNVDFTCHESKPTYDTWITGRHTVDIKGDVYVTNGVLRVYPGVVFSGDVIIGAWDTWSYLNDDGTTFNGKLVVKDGATFNFNNKAAGFGENATIVLEGGAVVNCGNIASWPKTVIESGLYVYGTVPIVNADCTVRGGKLRVSVAKDGDEETLDLGQIKVPDGVDPEDVIIITDTRYNWTLTVDETTRVVTATKGEAKTAEDANVWYGGADGSLSNGQNWTRGVPVEGQILAFATDAVLGSEYAAAVKSSPKIVVDEGVSLSLDLSTLGDVTAGNGIALGGAFEGDVSGIVFTDSRAWDWTASVGEDGKLYATPKSTYQNHWIGGESGRWNDDANWEFGIPKMTECAVFTNSAIATAVDNGEHRLDKLIIGEGFTLTFTAETGANWPQLNMAEFPAGGGGLVVGIGGIESTDGRELRLDGDITLTNDGTRDAFIKAKNGRIVINGKLTIAGEGTKGYIYGENNMEINGEVAISTSATARNIRIRRAVVNGPLTGTGYIEISSLDSSDGSGNNHAFNNQMSLNGDNRDFHGRIDKISDNGCTLGGPNAAGTNVEWHVWGDIHLVADDGQVWKFGALSLISGAWNVTYVTKGASITLEVGSLGTDMSFQGGYRLWGEGANTDIHVTIRKVGAGKLTTGLFNYERLCVDAGEVAFLNPGSADTVRRNISSVDVASGATISGTTGTTDEGDGMYIEALTLEPGAIVKQTVAQTVVEAVVENDEVVTPASTTYSCPALATTGAVNVTGVKFVLDDPNGYVTDLETMPETLPVFTVLKANAVAGVPAQYDYARLGVGSKMWKPVVKNGDSVVVKAALRTMAVIIR